MILQLLYSFTLLNIVVLCAVLLCCALLLLPLAKMSDQICHSFLWHTMPVSMRWYT